MSCGFCWWLFCRYSAHCLITSHGQTSISSVVRACVDKQFLVRSWTYSFAFLIPSLCKLLPFITRRVLSFTQRRKRTSLPPLWIHETDLRTTWERKLSYSLIFHRISKATTLIFTQSLSVENKIVCDFRFSVNHNQLQHVLLSTQMLCCYSLKKFNWNRSSHASLQKQRNWFCVLHFVRCVSWYRFTCSS